MSSNRRERIVRAIVEAILSEQEVAGRDEALDRVVAFILGQQARMPDYLQPPLTALTFALDLWPFLRGSTRPLHRLDRAARLPVLAAWKRSRLGVRRDLIRLYESLAVVGWAGDAKPKAPIRRPLQVSVQERLDG